jgi:hypothetical protein
MSVHPESQDSVHDPSDSDVTVVVTKKASAALKVGISEADDAASAVWRTATQGRDDPVMSVNIQLWQISRRNWRHVCECGRFGHTVLMCGCTFAVVRDFNLGQEPSKFVKRWCSMRGWRQQLVARAQSWLCLEGYTYTVHARSRRLCLQFRPLTPTVPVLVTPEPSSPNTECCTSGLGVYPLIVVYTKDIPWPLAYIYM